MTTWQVLRAFRVDPPRIDEPSATSRLRRRISGGPSHPPPQADLPGIHRDVSRGWTASRDLRALPARLFRKSPWVLFFPPGADPASWLGSEKGFFDSFASRFAAEFSPLLCRRLLTALLYQWPAGRCPLFQQWCELTNQGLAATDSPLLATWRVRQRATGFLAADGATRLAHYLLRPEIDGHGELADWGLLDGVLGQAAFLDHVLLALSLGTSTLRANPVKLLDRTTRVISLLERTPGKDLWFPHRAPEYVTNLLGPCLADPSTCRERVQQVLQAFALAHLGDPRVRRQNWATVPDAVLDLVLHWLAEESIDLFLEMISRHAVQHQWKERKRLWKKYFSMGVIQEAWVALGTDPHEDLVVSCRRQRTRVPPHARLVNVSTDQSVLLLRLQGWTIVEWSHNGACRFYAPNSRTAPRLYRRTYSGDDVRAPAYAHRIAHIGGDWVRSIDRFIRNEILP